MITRSLLVSILSVTILFLLLFIYEGILGEKEFLLERFLQAYFFGGIPVMGVGFVTICLQNYVVALRIKKGGVHNKNLLLFTYTVLFLLLPVLSFTLFDYSHSGRFFGSDGDFDVILGKYLPVMVATPIVFILNRRIVWHNFKNYKAKSN